MDQETSQRRTIKRRKMLSGIAVSSALIGSSTVGSAASNGSSERLDWDYFSVEGSQTIRKTFAEDVANFEIIKRSSDLNKRYGYGTIRESYSIDRERLREETGKDPYPDKEYTEVEQKEWDTYYGRTEEWKELAPPDSRGAGPDEDVTSPVDGDGASITSELPEGLPPVYFYECGADCFYGDYYTNPDCDNAMGHEVTGPISLIALDGTSNAASNVANYIVDECSYSFGGAWTTTIAECPRTILVWDDAAEENGFHKHDASCASNSLGVAGRAHARFWEVEADFPWVIGEAHIDSEVPHSSESYIEAEYEIMTCVEGNQDAYYQPAVNPGEYGDHNGWVSAIYNNW